MPTLDAIGRRKRTDAVSTGYKLRITDKDVVLLLALQRHGILSTKFLNRYHDTHYDYTVHRLSHLNHEIPVGQKAQLIHRPVGQEESRFHMYNDSFYSLTPAGRKWLQGEGLYEDALRPSGAFTHQMMTSAVTASVELICGQHGINYIPGHIVLGRHDKTLKCKLNGKYLVPDQLFQLKYPEDSYRTFVVECDRGNEAIEETTNSIRNKNKTLMTSYGQYKAFVGTPKNRPYKTHYGVKSGLLVLNVMTSPSKMLSYMKKIGKSNYMLFQHVIGFERAFRSPQIMSQLLTGEWLRPDCDPIKIDE